MSTAPITEDMLHAYVDEQLTAAERAAVEQYLSQHSEQAERVEGYRHQREQIKAAFHTVLHEPVPERFSARRFELQRHRLVRVAAAVAWITFGGLAGWALRGQIEQAEPRPSAETEIIERARVAHTIYSAETRRAVEVAASQEQDMIRWLSKRMNAAVRVPKLAEFGFEALGGRLLPGNRGPACQIMYQNAQGKRLTIYLARDAGGAAKPLHFSDKDAVHVVFWSDGTLAFAVSGELNNEELKRIAEAIARDARSRG